MGNPSASFRLSGGSGMSHRTRKSFNSQVTLSLAPGYLKCRWKVEQFQHEGLRATHPLRAWRRGQGAAGKAGDVGFPRGVKQLAPHRPYLAREPSARDMGTPARGHRHPTRPMMGPAPSASSARGRRGTGTRVGGLLRIRRGSPSRVKLTALLHCQKDKANGTPGRKGAGARRCPAHLSERANKREGGERDL